MSLADSLLFALVPALAPMGVLWLVSLLMKNVTIVDAYWGFGFVLVGWVTGLRVGLTPSSYLILAVLTLWGLRLSIYLATRTVGHAEDRRYASMRERYRPFWFWSLVIVFLLQGVLIWIVSLPVQVALARPSSIDAHLVIGCAIALLGLVFETVADWQLARFKAAPEQRGQVLDRGLWRYSRHPNYFGDFLVWWGLFVMCWRGLPLAWTVIGPITMSTLLLRVSGVTLLESSIVDRRPAYREYQMRTSSFFPRPPKSDVGSRA